MTRYTRYALRRSGRPTTPTTPQWEKAEMKTKALAILLLTAVSTSAIAVDLFSVTIRIGSGQPRTFSFSDAESAFEQIDEKELRAAFPSYTDMSTAVAEVDFRGLDMKFSFPSNTSQLLFEVPSLDIRKTFMGRDRDDSVDELEDFLKSEGGDLLNRIQAASIAVSPVDPIAGNPASMMGSMVSSQFETGFVDQTTTIPGSEPSTAGDESATASGVGAHNPDNLIHISPRFGRFTAGGRTSKVFTLPLGYSFRLKENNRKGLREVGLLFPVTYAKVEGGESYAASLGANLTHGVSKRWSLSPAMELGLAGSRDLGAAGGIGSASLTSAYRLPVGESFLNIGNMIGYYETLDIKIGSYSFDPGVSNTVLRNGVMYSVPRTMGGRKMSTELWVIDTRFFGSALYSEHYDEFGISFGLVKSRENRSIENHLRGGVSYLTGDGVTGWRANLGFSF